MDSEFDGARQEHEDRKYGRVDKAMYPNSEDTNGYENHMLGNASKIKKAINHDNEMPIARDAYFSSSGHRYAKKT